MAVPGYDGDTEADRRSGAFSACLRRVICLLDLSLKIEDVRVIGEKRDWFLVGHHLFRHPASRLQGDFLQTPPE
jgi:hypothetical protein